MTTIAVMQPYFMPYAGYFRLFCAADTFVLFDCVQFPRRGWVHRNRFPTADGQLDWLTLPVQKCPRDTRIADLALAPDAASRLAREMQRFPLLRAAAAARSAVLDLVTDTPAPGLTDYLQRQLAAVSGLLGLSRTLVRSSELAIDSALHGQARVIAIAKALGATRYVNSPGGRDLYDARGFAEHGLELRFLAPFTASTMSILTLLLTQPAAAVASLIRSETILCS